MSASVIVNTLLRKAEEDRASDIHMEPGSIEAKVRFRIDGILYEKYIFTPILNNEIVSRIKVLAHLRIDEHQRPQDGRFRVLLDNNKPCDVRVSILPSFHGETVVLRLLHDMNQTSSLQDLGMSKADEEKIYHILKRAQGMILVTGPTGSGKTTTLYSLLKKLNTDTSSIITIEDPVEYEIPGVRHIQTNQHTGLSFAQGLRSIVRQDPDIIMVGEIRDTETASIAVHTALTGHLLLSTLHTTTAATALPRLIDMDIDPYLIASTVEIIIGQRLVRKRCTSCLNGCAVCNQSGFIGRIGIYEILPISESIRTLIMQKVPAQVIQTQATQEGMTLLLDDGLTKVEQGITTLEEVMNSLS